METLIWNVLLLRATVRAPYFVEWATLLAALQAPVLQHKFSGLIILQDPETAVKAIPNTRRKGQPLSSGHTIWFSRTNAAVRKWTNPWIKHPRNLHASGQRPPHSAVQQLRSREDRPNSLSRWTSELCVRAWSFGTPVGNETRASKRDRVPGAQPFRRLCKVIS